MSRCRQRCSRRTKRPCDNGVGPLLFTTLLRDKSWNFISSPTQSSFSSLVLFRIEICFLSIHLKGIVCSAVSFPRHLDSSFSGFPLCSALNPPSQIPHSSSSDRTASECIHCGILFSLHCTDVTRARAEGRGSCSLTSHYLEIM